MNVYGRKVLFPLLTEVKREAYVDLLQMSKEDLHKYISAVIEKLPSEANEHIGIAKIQEDNQIRMNLGRGVSKAIATDKGFVKAQEMRKWQELQNNR